MVTLKALAYITGLVIAITLFGLVLFSFIPNVIYNSGWENIDRGELTAEALGEVFAEHPAYIAMYERFPDAVEEITPNTHNRGGDIRVGHINLETGNSLILNMWYGGAGRSLHGQVVCNVSDPDSASQNLHHDLLFAANFIKSTTCLE